MHIKRTNRDRAGVRAGAWAGLVVVGWVMAAGWSARAQEGVEEEVPDPAKEAPLLTGVRQLTFDGKRSGEGYFSADGTKMVFQSEREPGNPFYQIYLLDLETGDTGRVSPGLGKTTCAWIHPDGGKVLFASTHLDPEARAKQEAELEERASGRVRRYSWDYDPAYDLFAASLDTGELERLTEERGYDAEGAYSPCGEWIIFASNRAAYEGELGAAEQERLKIDPSYFMDLFLMRADGSEVQQLTDEPGYDGGPFFSADGRQICWRRFGADGHTAEIYVMDLEKREERQVTRLGAMSWAPFFHPSGEYLIFASNLQGFGNFELYLVDAGGEREPVRVTHSAGFDGLPVFTPDGAGLAWTSGRTAGGASQIFRGSWDHEEALRVLGLGAGGGLADGGAAAVPGPETPSPETGPEISVADLRAHLGYLASDDLRGRMTGTEGEQLATAYVARQLAAMGLAPAGDGGSYFQEFEFTAGVELAEGNRLDVEVGGERLAAEVNVSWRPLSFSESGEVEAVPVVFAGYGIEVPEGEEGGGYSSYFHLDVKDKWVMVFRYLPGDLDADGRRRMARYGGLRYKAMVARERGARGLIVVSGPRAKVNDQLVPLAFDASLAGSGVAAISVGDELAAAMVAASGKELGELQEALDGGEPVQGFELEGVRVGGDIEVVQERRVGRNVLAVLRAGEGAGGRAPLVIGAHIDHLGDQMGPSSRAEQADELSGDLIHNGADDNASGVAAILEMAEQLSHEAADGGLGLTRDVIFAAWSGEEIGLLGSAHFVRELAAEVAGGEDEPLGGHLSAYLNLDMVGRLEERLVLQGLGSSSYWRGEIERRNVPVGLAITTQDDSYLPTDASSFYTRRVPILAAFTGAHEDYHKPSDTEDKVNYEGLKDITRLMGLIARGLASGEDEPDYLEMERPKNQGSVGGLRVYLGTIPDYAQGDIKGVKLSGVANLGPAAKAGVKGGDVIVEIGGREIENLYDYTFVMGELEVGVAVEMVVLRDGERVKLEVVPGSRD